MRFPECKLWPEHGLAGVDSPCLFLGTATAGTLLSTATGRVKPHIDPLRQQNSAWYWELRNRCRPAALDSSSVPAGSAEGQLQLQLACSSAPGQPSAELAKKGCSFRSYSAVCVPVKSGRDLETNVASEIDLVVRFGDTNTPPVEALARPIKWTTQLQVTSRGPGRASDLERTPCQI